MAPPPGQGELAPYDDYYRPPLAKDLFANRPLFVSALEAFPQCKTIVPMLRDPAVTSGQKSIEVLLQEIEEEAKTYARGQQELAAVRCYLQRAISECEVGWRNATKGITNHLTLLREIERTHKGDRPVCLVTFNYDTLLEDALRQLGFGIGRMEHYTAQGAPFQVFKLHGSVNWAQEVEIELPPNVNPGDFLHYLIENASRLQISNRFVLCKPASMQMVNGHPVFPAIAVPVEKKQVSQCPEHMIQHLIAFLPEVTKILVIGWRATELHFLDLLKRYLQPGVYVSIVARNRDEAGEIGVRINQFLANNPPSSTAEPTGFTEFVRSRRAEQILAAPEPYRPIPSLG